MKPLYKMTELSQDGEILKETWIPEGTRIRIATPDEINRRIEMKEKRLLVKHLRADNPFCFVAYEKVGKMKAENLTKLIFLSTFIKFDSGDLMKTERTRMYKKDLPDILGISKRKVSEFLGESSDFIFINDDDESVSINKSVFCRSKLAPEMYNHFTRAYIKSIQSLYNSANVRQHRQLGYLFLMLPYLNKEFNVICVPEDIFETDPKQIRTISFAEFCDLIGYDYHNAKRLKTAYKKLQFTCKDGKLWDLVRIIDEYSKIYINPNVFYAGDDLKRVELLDTLFS